MIQLEFSKHLEEQIIFNWQIKYSRITLRDDKVQIIDTFQIITI